MLNYKMEVYAVETTEGIQWNVEFPDVKGCGGSGNTQIGAINDAEENLKQHLVFLQEEGLDIPKLEPVNLTNNYSGKFTIRMSKSLHKTASELANLDEISLNAFAVEAISRYCGQQEGLANKNLKPCLIYDYENQSTFLGGVLSNVVRR